MNSDNNQLIVTRIYVRLPLFSHFMVSGAGAYDSLYSLLPNSKYLEKHPFS